MTDKRRFIHIDILRAIAITGVMLTHSLALFLGSAPVNMLWNYLHFVVVAFVFCSGYVTYHSFKPPGNLRGLLFWYKKRFIRLYLPFLVYLILYAALVLLLPAVVSGRGIILSQGFFIKSLLLTNGSDVGWLPLLFIQFAILTPILVWLVYKKIRVITVLIAIGLFVAVTTILRIPQSYSRAVAWFPWLLIFIFGMVSAKQEVTAPIRSRVFLITGIFSIVLWLIITVVLLNVHRPVTLTLHKYPPDVYYFFYGIGINGILLAAVKNIHYPGTILTPAVTYLSKHAYVLFFMHLIVLDAVKTIVPQLDVVKTTGMSILLTVLLLWSGLGLFTLSKKYIASVNSQ